MESIPAVGPTAGSSSVNRLPSFNNVACTSPEGRTWNSAALVVSTTGPPSRTSTLMAEGRVGAAFDCNGALAQLTVSNAAAPTTASEKDNWAELNRPPDLIRIIFFTLRIRSITKENTIFRNYTG